MTVSNNKINKIKNHSNSKNNNNEKSNKMADVLNLFPLLLNVTI